VFIDETWAKTNMTRTHGRCARGERLVAKAPFGRWRTLTFLAALRCDGLTAPCVIDGPINGASFRAYVEQALARSLSRATSPSWTTSAATRAAPSRRHSRRQSQALFPARLFARPQSNLRQNEDLARARPTPEPSKRLGEPSAPCSTALRRQNAQTTSKTQDMLQPNQIAL